MANLRYFGTYNGDYDNALDPCLGPDPLFLPSNAESSVFQGNTTASGLAMSFSMVPTFHLGSPGRFHGDAQYHHPVVFCGPDGDSPDIYWSPEALGALTPWQTTSAPLANVDGGSPTNFYDAQRCYPSGYGENVPPQPQFGEVEYLNLAPSPLLQQNTRVATYPPPVMGFAPQEPAGGAYSKSYAPIHPPIFPDLPNSAPSAPLDPPPPPAVPPLKQHRQRRHERSHSCSHSACGRNFKRSTDLTRHVRSLHDRPPYGELFRCQAEGCDRVFVRKDKWREHMSRHGA